MSKTIMITRSTDGIGRETAKRLLDAGHIVLLHGRSSEQLKRVSQSLLDSQPGSQNKGQIDSFIANLSDLTDVTRLAHDVINRYASLDVLIKNAGVFKTTNPITPAGLDLRFAVNTLAPYLLTKQLLSSTAIAMA